VLALAQTGTTRRAARDRFPHCANANTYIRFFRSSTDGRAYIGIHTPMANADVMKARGWRDPRSLTDAYQQPDEETLLRVVSEKRKLRDAK
jgi:hypothetical protein